MGRRSREASSGPDTEGLRAQVEDAQREVFELAEERALIGTAARELDLRALAVQHRAAYTKFTEALEKAAAKSSREGWHAGRRFLRTHAKADIHLLGFARSPVVRWYIRQVLGSPVRARRLLRGGALGDEERAWLLDYVEEHGLEPGLEALWRQIGGSDQESLGA